MAPDDLVHNVRIRAPRTHQRCALLGGTGAQRPLATPTPAHEPAQRRRCRIVEGIRGTDKRTCLGLRAAVTKVAPPERLVDIGLHVERPVDSSATRELAWAQDPRTVVGEEFERQHGVQCGGNSDGLTGGDANSAIRRRSVTGSGLHDGRCALTTLGVSYGSIPQLLEQRHDREVRPKRVDLTVRDVIDDRVREAESGPVAATPANSPMCVPTNTASSAATPSATVTFLISGDASNHRL